jgi:hypothetical protein
MRGVISPLLQYVFMACCSVKKAQRLYFYIHLYLHVYCIEDTLNNETKKQNANVGTGQSAQFLIITLLHPGDMNYHNVIIPLLFLMATG